MSQINIRKRDIVCIITAWTLLIFVGYNVLSVEAEKKDCSSITEPDDDFYCDAFDWGAYTPDRQSVDEVCDASEDYAKNPKHCDIAYELVEKQEKNMKKDLKEACKKANGDWIDGGYCDVKSTDRKQVEEYVEESPKKECKKANGDWIDGECSFIEDRQAEEETLNEVIKNLEGSEEWTNYPIEQKPIEEIEDWKNEVEEERLTGYDEEGKQLNVINNDYDDVDDGDVAEEEEYDDSSEEEESQDNEETSDES